jgi:hypothetical protein
MGHCQGRTCGQNINEILWAIRDKQTVRTSFTTRPPIKPVPVGILAQIRSGEHPVKEGQ